MVRRNKQRDVFHTTYVSWNGLDNRGTTVVTRHLLLLFFICFAVPKTNILLSLGVFCSRFCRHNNENLKANYKLKTRIAREKKPSNWITLCGNRNFTRLIIYGKKNYTFMITRIFFTLCCLKKKERTIKIITY